MFIVYYDSRILSDPVCFLIDEKCHENDSPSAPIAGKVLVGATNSIPVQIGSLAGTIDYSGNVIIMGGRDEFI